ncbi:MAG: isochorismatase family protein [Eubacteriales bacterium]
MKALLLIDIQKGLTNRNLYCKELFIKTINETIEKYRANNNQIIFVQHQNNQLVPNTADWEIDDNISVDKSDKFFYKDKGNAFTNQELVSFLKESNINDLLVGGLVSHGCVNHTCKGGIENGFKISLLKNGHSCWNKDAREKIESTELALYGMGVNIVDINTI